MPFFLLHHRHGALECDAALAAWQGFVSPSRRQAAVSTCLADGHSVWSRVEALDSAPLTHGPAAMTTRPR
jgi:hypothetical protein